LTFPLSPISPLCPICSSIKLDEEHEEGALLTYPSLASPASHALLPPHPNHHDEYGGNDISRGAFGGGGGGGAAAAAAAEGELGEGGEERALHLTVPFLEENVRLAADCIDGIDCIGLCALWGVRGFALS